MPDGLNRKVYGILRRPDGRPWPAATVEFQLASGSFTASATYPSSKVAVQTNDDGAFETDLWCNAEGLEPSDYVCTYPDGEYFTFTLVYGDGSPIRDTVLRGAGVVPSTPQSPLYATVQALLDARLAVRVELVEADVALEPGASLRSIVLIDTSAGDVTVTLPPLAEMESRSVFLKKVADDNLGIVDAAAADLVDGGLVFNLEMKGEFVELAPAGGQWRVIGKG
jgi:hypothetical protein